MRFRFRGFFSAIALTLSLSSFNYAQEIDEETVQKTMSLAEKGEVSAQEALGEMYSHGLGVRQDYEKAKDWYQKAALQGSAKAQFTLGEIYFLGKGTREDYTKSKDWYEKAARQDYAKAQSVLGVLYSDGLGVRKDYTKAKDWFGKACDNGQQDGCAAYNRLIREGF